MNPLRADNPIGAWRQAQSENVEGPLGQRLPYLTLVFRRRICGAAILPFLDRRTAKTRRLGFGGGEPVTH